MTAILRLALRVQGTDETTRVATVLAVLAVAVTTTAALVAGSGVQAFGGPIGYRVGPDADGMYFGLAVTAAALLAVPVLTLGGVAARLAVARRNHRLATLRLCGATSGQVTAATLAETLLQSVAGVVLGVLAHLSLLPVLSGIRFRAETFPVGQLWLPVPVTLAVAVAVVTVGLLSAAISLAAVRIGPLGVTQRVSPARVSAVRVLAALAMIGTWLVATRVVSSPYLMVSALVITVAVVNVMGPI